MHALNPSIPLPEQFFFFSSIYSKCYVKHKDLGKGHLVKLFPSKVSPTKDHDTCFKFNAKVKGLIRQIIKQTRMSHTLTEALRTTLSDGSSRCDPSVIAATLSGKAVPH